ncbi:MAG: helix-turn-helix transcriptional regulator [Boseongicola sp. SB0662_bin_57]|nr:helix-turn-helix transcriptional regulator [Boseongicola sp. SB0662_bin_57]
MNERDAICPEAVKAYRKRANGKRGFTQQQLAEKIRCSKDTVSRWERGETSRVRAHLREPLCKALGVKWDVLTKPPDLETTERPFGFTRMQRWVSRHVPPALLIVARRYGIRPMDVLDIAPLLFLIAAERSLLERRRRLDEIWKMRDEASQGLVERSAHLGAIVAAASHSAENILEEEEKSLRQRDVFGHLIEYERRRDDDEGPFVHFIRCQAEGLPQDAVDSIESHGGDTVASYRIAGDTLGDLTGIVAGEEDGDEILDCIWSGDIDLNECLKARQEQDESGYRQWLRDAQAEANEASMRELTEWLGVDAAIASQEEKVR